MPRNKLNNNSEINDNEIIMSTQWKKLNKEDIDSIKKYNSEIMFTTKDDMYCTRNDGKLEHKEFMSNVQRKEGHSIIEVPVTYVKHESGLYIPCIEVTPIDKDGRVTDKKYKQVGHGLTAEEYDAFLCKQYDEQQKQEQSKENNGVSEIINNIAQKKGKKNVENVDNSRVEEDFFKKTTIIDDTNQLTRSEETRCTDKVAVECDCSKVEEKKETEKHYGAGDDLPTHLL